MNSNDQRLLEEAYNQVNEGIWDRLKGMGSGIKAGAGVIGQNIKNKAITTLGGQAPQGSGNTTGQAYAKAQQGSLLGSFVKKATKEIADFKNDLSKMGIKQTDADLRAAGLDEIADKIKGVEDLLAYLQNPQAQQNEPQQQQQQQPQAQPAATGKRRTGGKIAGQVSQTPRAIKGRAQTAAKKTQGAGNHPLDTNRDGTISAAENPTKSGKPIVGGSANAPGTSGQRGRVK